MRYCMYGYLDGTEQGVALLLGLLPHVAHAQGCMGTGGYVPTLPWLIQILEARPRP